MTCDEARQLLDGYFDGELDLIHSMEVERHLEECRACAAAHERYRQLRGAFQSGSLYEHAPAALRERIGSAIRANTREEVPRVRPREYSVRWLAIAASVLVLVGLGAALLLIRPAGSDRDLVAREVVDAHIRSLMGNHLTDVVSSDRHTVKPWFNGKLDFSPAVKDLTASGFPLVGGRLDYIDGRPAAALVYHCHLHTINLFIWPSAATGRGHVPAAVSTRGYHVVTWVDSGMAYWAVSDVQLEDLDQFARDVQEK